jgi:hypothetical protein
MELLAYSPVYGAGLARDIGTVCANELVFPRPHYVLQLDPADTSDITQVDGRHDRLRCMAYLYDDHNNDRTALLDDLDGEPITTDVLEVRFMNDRDVLIDNKFHFIWPPFRITEPGWYHFRIEAWYTPIHPGPTRVIATGKSPRFYCFPRSEGSSSGGTSSGRTSLKGQEGVTSLPGLGTHDKDRGEGTSSRITRED